MVRVTKLIQVLVVMIYCQHFLFSQNTDPPIISVDCQGLTIAKIIGEIEYNYPYKVYIHQPSILLSKIRTNSCNPAEIEIFLANLLIGTGYGYLRYDDRVFVVADSNRLNRENFEKYFSKKNEIENNFSEKAGIIGHPDSISRAGTATIKGLVIDGKTDSVIIGAYVKIMNTPIATATELDGSFELKLDIGAHLLNVESSQYHTYQSPIKVYGNGYIVVKLYSSSIELPELVIGASARSRLESVNAGIAELNLKEIKRLPTLLGETDVLKALLTLPGVSNTGEVGSGFNVRGGNIDQNLIQQDGVFYLNPSHVLGLFSAFNPDAIKQVTFYKGHVPAQFGGRTSSVLDIKLKDPNYSKWSVFGGIGPISSKIFIDGPLVKDRTSLFIGSRFTYSDWVLKLLRDPNLKNSKADFHDINFKLSHKLNIHSTLQLSFYRSKDRFRYSDQFGYGWEANTGSLQFTHQFSDKVILHAIAMYSDSKNEFEDATSSVQNNLSNGMAYAKAKINVAWQPLSSHHLNLGIETTNYLTKPEVFTAGLSSDQFTSQVQQSKGTEYAAYVNDEISLGRKLNLSIGLRQSLYVNSGPEIVRKYLPNEPRITSNQIDSTVFTKGQTIATYSAPEPRVSLAWNIGDQGSIKWSYNRLAQYIHLISNSAAATPVDIWQMSNTYIKPQQANNYSIGYYQNFNEDQWETSFELFTRSYKNLVEYKDFAKLLRNDHIETELLSVKGLSYGAEFYVRRNKNNPNGYISYTWSRSLRKANSLIADEIINNGSWYPSNFDKPHNFNAVMNIQIRKTMSFALNFVYNTGRPLTAPVADFYLGDKGVFLDYSNRNEYRIPDYHRLDLSLTFTRGAIRSHKNKGSFTFAVYNFYSRKNAFSVFYRRSVNTPLVAYKLSVLGTALPSVTYNFQF